MIEMEHIRRLSPYRAGFAVGSASFSRGLNYMSASREKKQRQQAEGLTERQRQQAQEARKATARRTLYSVAGVIAALLVAALLIWNSGFFQRRAVAVTVGKDAYTTSDLSYYYYLVANQTASTAKNYAQYGINIGYDPDRSPADQMYDDDTTYAEYFRQTAWITFRRWFFFAPRRTRPAIPFPRRVRAQWTNPFADRAVQRPVRLFQGRLSQAAVRPVYDPAALSHAAYYEHPGRRVSNPLC
jgi:hypothetical protein